MSTEQTVQKEAYTSSVVIRSGNMATGTDAELSALTEEHRENDTEEGAPDHGDQGHGHDISQQSLPEGRAITLKSQRRQVRAKITRKINRIRESIMQNVNPKRLQKEIVDLNKDITHASELHSELYDYMPVTEHSRMDHWEADLLDARFSIEEQVEDYVSNFVGNRDNSDNMNVAAVTHRPTTRSMTTASDSPISDSSVSTVPVSSVGNGSQTMSSSSTDPVPGAIVGDGASGAGVVHRDDARFDSWIDKLIEFKETEIIRATQDMSMADVLYRLEASKDIPHIELIKFDGNPLKYVEFIETFKIHVHEKHYLSDDMRMAQLKMHLTGEAEKAISGLGCGGVMYATALKIVKEQFGQESIIARACINRLTKGSKIAGNNRQGLRDLSHDIVNSIAVLKRMNYLSDSNSTESLRQVVMRFPDFLITKWKGKVTEIRDQGDVPTLEHISRFIRKQVRSMFDPDFGDLETYRKADPKGGLNRGRQGVHAAQNVSSGERKTMKCYVCSAAHRVTECPTLIDSSVTERIELAKANRLCYGCLGKNHVARECRSKTACGKDGCTRTHHKLLHVNPPSASGATPVVDKDGILPVVRARFRAPNGRVREGNVLIDSGAGVTIIRKDFAKALGLQGRREGLQLSVVGGERLDQRDSRHVKFWVSPMNGGEEFEVEAHEIDKTVISVPPLDRPWLSSFTHLSDLNFTHKAGPVDLILGVQYSHLHAEEEIRQGLPFEPVGKQTKLGWFVIGPDKTSTSAVCSVNFVEKIDMTTFYDLETVGVRAPDCTCPLNIMSPDDKRAMDMFKSSCHKDDNRYVIGLPWKKDPSLLPNNYSLAEKRLESLEKSLLKNPDKAEMYCNVIDQYKDNQWAVPVTSEELQSDTKPVYYLPHHGVYRPDKLSTPLRVVFDPACEFKGVSLNSFLLKGPNLIGDLLGVLLRFREERVAFIGDISKMFLQILLENEDSQVHRFLWRDLNISQDPTVYRLTRVTFGDKPSPDMASFVMLKIAEENQEVYPEAATILKRDRYVDDLIHSCKTPSEATDRMKHLNEILASGSFKIKEWFCSSAKAIKDMNESKPEIVSDQSYETERDVKTPNVDLDSCQNLKTLGVSWDPTTDSIHFQVKDLDSATLTKRAVLSWMSMLYDPLGLASVVTVRCRIAMQEIWKLKLDWDDPLPAEICNIWKSLFIDLQKLETVRIPRCMKPENTEGIPELHVFADASILAYGSVAYLLWPTSERPSIRLVSAKVKVAPLRQTTIPRLELMAVLLASRLAKTITEEFAEKPTVTIWTDSQIVLHWVQSDSISLKAFVGVRVAEIQSTWGTSHFKYVPTSMNPADDLSRGLDVDKMTGRWINGPAFLSAHKDEWPQQPVPQTLSVDNERKKYKAVYANVKTAPVIDCNAFSNWQRLLRVTAYCKRFICNLKTKLRDPSSMVKGPLQPSELIRAEEYWIQQTQGHLSEWQEKYRDLAPFDQDGIICVGGRLSRSSLPYERVHPVLLPASSQIANLIMRDIHSRMGHPGCERTLCESRRRFWIVKGRSLARKTVRACVICRKLRQPAHATLMAELPPERLRTFSPVFMTTGVDLFGPFNLKYGRNKVNKAWGALFTCATVRAIHLEIVDSLSTQSFLHALRRFVAQHAWPTTIISDNGTSFVGAQAELRKLVQDGRKQIEDFAMLHKVKWIFITPLSPHQGGFYESLIKQTKRALQVAVGRQTLTWNEMSTVFAEAKCLVNSRPLGYASNDPNDLQPLTPNHFLLGRASVEVPQGPFQETKNLHKRFEFVQSIVNQFWKRFVQEYLPTLMRRSKWILKGRQLEIGDIVLLTDPNVSRGKWDLARIMNVFPGHDGIIRNVEVKTKSGVYRRSIQRCCPILEATHD